MYPNCWGYDCTFWGVAKATDFKTKGITSLAHTYYGEMPYMQLQLSAGFNITSVKL